MHLNRNDLFLKYKSKTDIAIEKQRRVIIVYIFQSCPDFSDLITQAIKFITVATMENMIQENEKILFLFFNILNLLFFKIAAIVIIIRIIISKAITMPNLSKVLGPSNKEHTRLSIKYKGANIIQANVKTSPTNFFAIKPP